ncbi:MAG TPA: PP2C family protein-serine/threonine phosphatase, partial [bacterium]
LEGWDIWLYTQPANDVGGDLVDYLYLDQSRLQIALADVAGKGLGAALLMAKLQATLRALAPNFKSLGELGAQVNEILCRDGLPNRFASLVYLEIMADSNKVRLLNAGHMPPILIRDRKIVELPKGKSALGLHKKSKYNEQKIILKPNDVLVIYSDGITEARNEQGAFFNEQRLLNLLVKLSSLTVAELGKRIIAEVERFIGEARRHDDVSLVILRKIN